MPEEIPFKNVTTNEVLREAIDGLSKLTNVEFGHVNETLKDMKNLMSGFATRNELEEVKRDFNASVKRIEEGLLKRDADLIVHAKDDKENFGTLEAGQKETRDTILKWGAVGAFLLLAIPYLLPFIINLFKR